MPEFKITSIVCAITLIIAGQAFATNGHQLMGIGAYQKSMGGATTAAPHDTTTAISNPAGMALIGVKADFNFDAFMPNREISFKDAGGESDSGGSPLYLAPAVGWVGPVGDRDDLFFGGGMFLTSGMGVDYSTINTIPFGAAMGDMTYWKGNLYSQYQFWKLAPTLAKKYGDKLAVGFSLNIDYQQLAFKQKYFNPNDSSQYIGADLSRATGGLGFGFTFGVIYKVNDMIQVGGTYISKQSFSDIDYRLSQGDVVFPDGAGNMLVSGNGTYSLGMDFPQQIAFGVAITPNENLKITVDFKWINFEDTHDELSLNGEFALQSQTTGAMTGSTNSMPLPFGWENQTVYAIGVEYMVSPMLTLRAGYNHADSPIGEEDVFNNVIFPAIVEDHIGLGAEFILGNHWGVGLAYMKAMSNEIKGKGDLQGGNSGATLTMDQSSLLISISYNMGK